MNDHVSPLPPPSSSSPSLLSSPLRRTHPRCTSRIGRTGRCTPGRPANSRPPARRARGLAGTAARAAAAAGSTAPRTAGPLPAAAAAAGDRSRPGRRRTRRAARTRLVGALHQTSTAAGLGGPWQGRSRRRGRRRRGSLGERRDERSGGRGSLGGAGLRGWGGRGRGRGCGRGRGWWGRRARRFERADCSFSPPLPPACVPGEPAADTHTHAHTHAHAHPHTPVEHAHLEAQAGRTCRREKKKENEKRVRVFRTAAHGRPLHSDARRSSLSHSVPARLSLAYHAHHALPSLPPLLRGAAHSSDPLPGSTDGQLCLPRPAGPPAPLGRRSPQVRLRSPSERNARARAAPASLFSPPEESASAITGCSAKVVAGVRACRARHLRPFLQLTPFFFSQPLLAS